MQVEIDIKCMQGIFGGCGIFGFGDFTPFQTWVNFPFGLWAWGSKNKIGSKNSCKQSLRQNACKPIFDEHGHFDFGDFAPFCLPSETAKFPFQTMDYYSPWGSKNRIGSKNLCK